nr:transglutaminase-like domain-containing protein [Quadrisphaera sp. RL12-1S]
MVGVASLGWVGVLDGLRWVAVVAAGAALGAALGLAAVRWRWPVLLTSAAAVVVLLVAGPAAAVPGRALAGVLPTPSSTVAVLAGALRSWKELLTLPAPVQPGAGSGAVLVAPLVVALVAGAVVTAGVQQRRAWWVALLPAPAVLVVTALLGTDQPLAPALRGAALVVGSLAWASWRRDRSSSPAGTPAAPAARSWRRPVGAAALLALGAVGGVLAAPAVGASTPRLVLRDALTPPFDPASYPSPLAAYRHYVKDLRDQTVFEVTGLPQGARLRLAVMDAYDGTVWDVAGSAPSPGSGRWVPLAGEAPSGATVRLGVVDRGYSGVWLPTTGDVTDVRFTGPRAAALQQGLHYDSAAQVAVTSAGLAPGDGYTVRAEPVTAITLTQLLADPRAATAPAATTALPAPATVPTGVGAFAAEHAGDGSAAQRAQGLATALQQGFFSHGLEGDAASRAGHGAGRLASMLASDQMIGDDEQYAALMALAARQVGLSSRVVMGFAPQAAGGRGGGGGAVTVTGGDVRAWTEVDVQGVGWVAVDATPDPSRVPQPQSARPRSVPEPQVQPQQEPAPQPQQPQARSTDTDQPDRDRSAGGLPWGSIAAGGAPVLLVVLLSGGLVLTKALRQRRRRTRGDGAQRMVGAWEELVDTARDLGAAPPVRATRREAAAVLPPEQRAAATALAERVDAGAFAPRQPSEPEVTGTWSELDELLGHLRAGTSRRRRLWARVTPRSLWRRR